MPKKSLAGIAAATAAGSMLLMAAPVQADPIAIDGCVEVTYLAPVGMTYRIDYTNCVGGGPTANVLAPTYQSPAPSASIGPTSIDYTQGAGTIVNTYSAVPAGGPVWANYTDQMWIDCTTGFTAGRAMLSGNEATFVDSYPVIDRCSDGIAAAGQTQAPPAPIIQGVALPASGACSDVFEEQLSFARTITGGWTRTWEPWTSPQGGWACTRVLQWMPSGWIAQTNQ